MPDEDRKLSIRPATEADIDTLLLLSDEARQTMRLSGNTKQWGTGYPSADDFRRDMERGASFVVTDGERPVATFAFLPSPEPTYAEIEDGAWIDDTLPYHVVHRIAARRGAHGIFGCIMNFCWERTQNLRIDTHRDNLIMRHLLAKHGFAFCGIIHLANGDERLAFQRIHLSPRHQ